jgi:hypothetical protein
MLQLNNGLVAEMITRFEFEREYAVKEQEMGKGREQLGN